MIKKPLKTWQLVSTKMEFSSIQKTLTKNSNKSKYVPHLFLSMVLHLNNKSKKSESGLEKNTNLLNH